ncbi:MAG TPA: hypothetical protein VK870_16920 [Ignavibacteriaceae bacterium]|nr:hypothetical protein [Ignavibacteriaceae bacterium]
MNHTSITFENNLQLPLNIQPNDTVEMHVYLNGFYYITYSNSSNTIPLKVKIVFISYNQSLTFHLSNISLKTVMVHQ